MDVLGEGWQIEILGPGLRIGPEPLRRRSKRVQHGPVSNADLKGHETVGMKEELTEDVLLI